MTLRIAFRKSIAGLAIAALVATSTDAAAWRTAHGNPDNTGFANVNTVPAKEPRKITNIGSFADGAAPVIGPEGMVYLVNEQGKVMAFTADGAPRWSREIGRQQSILASPAIGSDGSLYVIGVRKYRDSRLEPPERVQTTLNIFTSGGGAVPPIQLPDHNGFNGATTAAPNIWRHNGEELVLIPMIYKAPLGHGIEIRLLAYSRHGGLVDDVRVSTITPRAYGGINAPILLPIICLAPIFTWACVILEGSSPHTDTAPSFPSVSVFTNPAGGTPWIVVSDQQHVIVGYTFSGGVLRETFRQEYPKLFLRSSPMTLPNGHTLVGADQIDFQDNGAQLSKPHHGALVFGGPNLTKVPDMTTLPVVRATPARLMDGRVVFMGGHAGRLYALQDKQIVATAELGGYSYAALAASRTHIFASTSGRLVTLDAKTLQEVAAYNWGGGGYINPSIGPEGHVYAIANQTFHVFPAPPRLPGTEPMAPLPPGANNPLGGVMQDAGIVGLPPSGPTTQSYKPPMTANNNRLFACEELDGDDCGNGDHRAISLAFCQGKGFIKADDFDVDSRKVKAETLGGQFCSKNKCKVFDEIVCAK